MLFGKLPTIVSGLIQSQDHGPQTLYQEVDAGTTVDYELQKYFDHVVRLLFNTASHHAAIHVAVSSVHR
jgi:hypothetical protein